MNSELIEKVKGQIIKKNYKKLVTIFHPDVNDNNKIAEKKFKEINEAYRILLKKFKKTKI
jgi:curved DNA-binding protein